MIRIFIQVLLFLFFSSQLSLAQTGASKEDILKFCVFPNKSPKVLYSMYHPLIKRLSEATGKTVKLVTAPDKQTFQQRALAGEYDLAVACVACYFQLRDKKGYRAIVRGEPSFQGGVIVKKESAVTDPLQLQGKKVAAMRRHSYAGYLFFRAWLTEHGVADDAQPDYLFLDWLESIVYSVLSGQADACLIRLDALNASKLARYKDELRVILKSVEIPQFPFIVSSTLEPPVVQQIIGALTSLKPADLAAKKLFQVLKISSLKESSDADYEQFEHTYTRTMEIAGEARGN